MIGWINLSIEAFITETFGADKWQEVVSKATIDTSWVSSCPYSDKVTYDIVITAAGILGVTVNQALEAYGGYFVKYVAMQGYSKLLACLGSTFGDFLRNLNNLHLHLSLSFESMAAPAFRCDKVTPESLELHYYSKRPGLWPLLVGVLHGMARDYFGIAIEVELLSSRDDCSCDHEVLLVRYPYQESMQEWVPDEGAAKAAQRYAMSGEAFFELFPFHLLMDPGMQLLQVGPAMQRLFPTMKAGLPLADFFKLHHPHIDFSFDSIALEVDNAFLLRSSLSGLEFKGQMVVTSMPDASGAPASARSGCPFAMAAAAAAANGTGGVTALTQQLAGHGVGGRPALLFLCSPRLANLDDLQKHKLFLSDIPLHDMSRDFVLLAEQRQAEANLKERFEKLSIELKEERERSDRLLYQMLPRNVANKLRQGQSTEAISFPKVSILFSDVVGFTEIAAKCNAMQVCNMLNDMYTRFDAKLREFPDIFKVETIGDAYMLVCGATTDCAEQVDKLVVFAKHMHAAASEVFVEGKSTCIRIGIHSGPAVGGVVGSAMPRFCLFGDTVNTASRMESTGLPSKIHISSSAYENIVDPAAYAMEDRGEIDVKGKGRMRTWFIQP